MCCNGHDKINQDLNHRVTHLLSVARMEKGSATSITQALTQYNKKPPGIPTTGGLCLVHCMNPMDKFSSPYRSPVDAPWRKSQVCTQKINTSPAKGPMIHRELGKLSAIQQKNVQNMQSLPNWQSLKSSCFRQNLSVCQIIQVIITLESAKAGKLRCCQRQLLILITVIGNYVLFLHA